MFRYQNMIKNNRPLYKKSPLPVGFILKTDTVNRRTCEIHNEHGIPVNEKEMVAPNSFNQTL